MEHQEKTPERVIVQDPDERSSDAIIKLVKEEGFDFDTVILESAHGARCRVNGAQVKSALEDLAQANIIYP